MGNSQMKKKDYAAAVDSYKEALRNNPTDEQTRYNLSEAIRRLKDQQKKDNKNDSSQDNKDPQNQPNNKNNPSNKPKNDPGDKQENKGGKPNEEPGKNNPSKLPNKTVDRMLDKLMQDEAATKRKMGGSKENNDAVKSGKDW
jgi:hypothetical protein